MLVQKSENRSYFFVRADSSRLQAASGQSPEPNARRLTAKSRGVTMSPRKLFKSVNECHETELRSLDSLFQGTELNIGPAWASIPIEKTGRLSAGTAPDAD